MNSAFAWDIWLGIHHNFYQSRWNGSFGRGKIGQIKGIWKIRKSDEHSIDKVYYVESLKHEFLSISQLCDKGNEVIFLSTDVKVIKHKHRKLFWLGNEINMYTLWIPQKFSTFECDWQGSFAMAQTSRSC